MNSKPTPRLDRKKTIYIGPGAFTFRAWVDPFSYSSGGYPDVPPRITYIPPVYIKKAGSVIVQNKKPEKIQPVIIRP